jgi:Domain of unknown function (DUF4331)
MKIKKLILSLITATTLLSTPVLGSDHDDGESDLKARSLNLTDLYVFREDAQTGNPADADKLIFIMNTNPRSLARQQYFFSTKARYEFHVSRKSSQSAGANGADDVIIRLQFGIPDGQNRQPITLTIVKDGVATTLSNPMWTSNLGDSSNNSALILNQVLYQNSLVTVFAGLREDPFFFDVESFFRLRAAALGKGPVPATPFKGAAQAVDFTAGYNVNAIAVKIPIAALQSAAGERVFDVWETISVPK